MRAGLLCVRAARRGVWELFLRAAGRVGPRRLGFTELDCIAANGLSYATCVLDFLTFGCDGASAAAPIANANTAFIVRNLAQLRQLDRAGCLK